MDSGNMSSKNSEVAAKKALRQRFAYDDGLNLLFVQGRTFFVVIF